MRTGRVASGGAIARVVVQQVDNQTGKVRHHRIGRRPPPCNRGGLAGDTRSSTTDQRSHPSSRRRYRRHRRSEGAGVHIDQAVPQRPQAPRALAGCSSHGKGDTKPVIALSGAAGVHSRNFRFLDHSPLTTLSRMWTLTQKLSVN